MHTVSQQSATADRIHAARILLVEDDEEVSDSVASVLNKKGYHTAQRFNGRDGLVAAVNQPFHLILLDKMLPELDGLELLQRLRQYRDTPVIMLTACGAEQDRIDGFSTGADDYLPKPFNMTELLFRIEALLRRSMSPPQKTAATGKIHDGDLVLDTLDRSASWAGQVIDLTPIEFDLLHTLISHRDEILSKPYLYQLVLNKPFSRYDRSLDMHISNLRGKLAQVMPAGAPIKTVRGQGYRYL